MVVFEKIKKIVFTSLGNTESFSVKYLNRGGQGILYVLKDSPDKLIKVYWPSEETYDAALNCQTRNQNIFQEIKNRRDLLPKFIPDEKLVDFLNDFYEDCHPIQSGTCYLERETQQYPAQIMHFFNPFRELTDYFEGKDGLDLMQIPFNVRFNLVMEILEIYGYYCQKRIDNKSLVHTDLFPDNILILGDPLKEPNYLHLTLIDWAGSGIWIHSEKKWLEKFEPLTTGKDASAFYSYPAELEKGGNGRIDLTKFGPHTDYWFLTNAIFILLVGEQPFFFLNNTNASNLKVAIPEMMKCLSTKEWPPLLDDVLKMKEALSKIGIRFKPQVKNAYLQQVFETGRQELTNAFGPKALSILYEILIHHYNSYDSRPSPTLLFDEVYKRSIKKVSYHEIELYQVDASALLAIENQLGKPLPLLLETTLDSFGYQMNDGRVTGLFLSNQNINTLPFELFSLTGLKNLVLDHNKLTSIPSEISRLRYLTQLNLHHNQLETISDKIGSLIHLRELDLSENKLYEIPDKIQKTVELTHLDLSYNQLKIIPLLVFSSPNLSRFIIHHNFVHEIPEPIGNLIHLTECDLSFNLIKTIPKQLFASPELKTLNLNANFLSSFSIPPNISLPPQFTMETYEIPRVPDFDFKKK